MVPRVAVQQMIESDPDLATIGVQSVYGSNAVDSPSEDCFVILHWENTTRAFGHTGSTVLTAWVHDRDHDYAAKIDRAIARLKVIFEEAIHVPGSDGVTLTCATWAGDSDDLVDDGYNTITRNTSFTIVAR